MIRVIVFDMDNTLVDELGATVRPGIVPLLASLTDAHKTLHLWTNSSRERAVQILKFHNLHPFFKRTLFREDYDPQNIGLRKDLRKLNADCIVDDDPAEIRFAESIGKKGFLISAYRRDSKTDPEELKRLQEFLTKKRVFFTSSTGFNNDCHLD